MARLAAVILLLVPLAACTGDAPGQGPDDAPTGKSVGAFSLRAAGPFLAGEEPTLSIRTRSAGELALRLFRAADPVDLVKEFDDLGHPTVEGTPLARAIERATAGEAAGLSLVWSRRKTVAEGTGTLSLGPTPPGLYLLETRSGTGIARVPIVVGNLSLVVKRGEGELLAWVVRADSGRPATDAGLTLVAEEGARDLEIDSDGIARLEIGDAEMVRLVAVSGDDVAMVDSTWLPPAPRDRLVYVTTDRPLYRPGETVGVKGIARRVIGNRMEPFGAVESVVLVPPRGDPVPTSDPGFEVTDRGTFSGTFELPKKTALGSWRVVATVDGRRYGGEFRVEEFRRPEAEVLVSAEPSLTHQGDPVVFRITARYYAGGALADVPVSWSVHRTPRARPAWRDPDAEQFVGEQERRATRPVEVLRGEGRLDSGGAATVTVPTWKLADDTAFVLTARVRDETGRTTTGRGSALAVRSFVTVDLRTDRESYETTEIIVVTVRVRDRAGRPAIAPVRLTEVTGENRQAVHELETDANGLARVELTAGEAGPLRLEVTAMDDRERTARTEKTVWITREGLAPGYGGEGLSIVPDRETYAPGDDARLLVLLPSNLGHAHLLVTVESDRIHTHRVHLAETASDTIPLTVERRFGTAFRVRATAVRHGRVFRGEARLLAPPLDRRLRVDVSLGAETYRPGGRGFVTVRVTDHEGRPAPCELAVSGVDEALLALAPDLAPTILRFFHGPTGDRVRTFVSAAEAFYDATRPVRESKGDANFEAPDESASGDDEGMEGHGGLAATPGALPGAVTGPPAKKGKGGSPAGPPRATFAASALWAPHVLTTETGEAAVPVTFPDDLTRWRFAATAVDLVGRVGEGEGRAVTTRPLRLTVAAPRFLVERDHVAVPVVVRAPGHGGEKVTVVLDVDPRLGGEGEARLDLRLDGNGRAAAAIPLTGRVRGAFDVTGRAVRGGDRDAVTATIPVRTHGARRASVLAARLDGDRPFAGRLEVPRDAKSGSISVRLTFEPTRLAAIWRALDVLVGYPHGCTEQTLHRFLPGLMAQAAVTGLQFGDHPRAAELPGHVDAGLRRLAELQHADGGWGWWENDTTDAGMTALVLRGFRQAAEIGSPAPDDMVKRGTAALAALASRPDLDYETRALILETIPQALPPGYEERLFDDEARAKASPQTLAILLSHFRSIDVERPRDRSAEIRVLTEEILARASAGDAGTYWGSRTADRWQDDAVETTARVIRALAGNEEHAAVVEAATRWLLAQRDGDAWKSTRDTADAVEALTVLAMTTSGTKGRSAVRVRIDDGIVGQVSVTADGWVGKPVVLELPPPLLTPGAARRLTLERVGDIPVDVTAVLEYVSTREDLPAVEAGFAVARTIHRLEPVRHGNAIVHERRDAPGARVGDLLLLEATVNAAKPGEFVACEVPYPAGAEPVADPRAVTIEGGALPEIPDLHTERRDDAAWFFLRRVGGSPIRLRVLLRVTHAGDFHVLPARAELMYFPHVHGASAEARLLIEEE